MLQRSKWVLGRFLQTYPGKNGFVRSVLVKAQSNVVKRPITKLNPIITDNQARSQEFAKKGGGFFACWNQQQTNSTQIFIGLESDLGGFSIKIR